MLRDAADQHIAPAAAPVRAEQDQIRIQFVGVLEDAPRDARLQHGMHVFFDGHALFGEARRHLIEIRGGLVGREQMALAVNCGGGILLNGVKKNNGRLEPFGEHSRRGQNRFGEA